MTPFEQVVYIINIILLIVVLYLASGITRAGAKYAWNPGDAPLKATLTLRILKSIVVIIGLGILMAFLNLLTSYL